MAEATKGLLMLRRSVLSACKQMPVSLKALSTAIQMVNHLLPVLCRIPTSQNKAVLVYLVLLVCPVHTP